MTANSLFTAIAATRLKAYKATEKPKVAKRKRYLTVAIIEHLKQKI